MASTPIQLMLDIEDIALSDLTGALKDFIDFLGQLDLALSPSGKRGLTFRLTELSYSSPACIGAAIEPQADSPDTGAAVADLAIRGIQNLGDGSGRADELPYGSLEPLRRLAGYPGHGGRVVIARPDLRLQAVVTRQLVGQIERMTGHVESVGALQGHLDTVTVHGHRNFTLWDAVTGKAVTCFYPADMQARVVGLLGKRVIVHGEIKRQPNGVPTEVRRVDSLDSMMGAESSLHLAGIYAGLDVEKYLAETRGE